MAGSSSPLVDVRVDVRAEVEAALRQLDQFRLDQLPFAISLGVNWTALGAQRDIRSHVRQTFVLRRPTYVLGTIKIERGDFSTKKRPFAFRVSIPDYRTKKGRQDFLAKHELGGERLQPDRAFPFFIPSANARPSIRDLVPRRLYPGALRLQASRGAVGSYLVEGTSLDANGRKRKRRLLFGTLPALQKRTKRGILQWRGKRRTFVLDPLEHRGIKTWGIYQRTGPRREDVQLLWTYKARTTLPPRLRFVKTGEESVAREFQRNFQRAYAQALATARPITAP